MFPDMLSVLYRASVSQREIIYHVNIRNNHFILLCTLVSFRFQHSGFVH